ncbi:MAG: hypothetical protein ACRC0W_06725, partial [Cetobacterium sp.]
MDFNSYINYLNSQHNASGNNENAIAEQQILNDFYCHIMVERPLGNYLKNILLKENISIILTGHAGDGKTSLLYQTLRSMDLIEEKKPLAKSTLVNYENKNIMYIKDMSELNRDEQLHLINEGLNITNQGGSSIMISNTGPLIRIFKELFGESIENNLLNHMDSNSKNIFEVGEYKVLIINIAKLDNTDFIHDFLENISSTRFLNLANEREKNSFIYNNLKLINENLSKVSGFITNFYRNSYENGERFTLRQIIAHITYSITSNHTLEESLNKDPVINNIFNNFFGYKNGELDPNGLQIKGIKKIFQMKLDEKKIHGEDNIFIYNSFENFIEEIKDSLKNYWINTLNLNNDWDFQMDEFIEKSRKERQLIRRAMFFFNNFSQEEENKLLNSIFSNIFTTYINCKYNLKLESSDKNELERNLRDGLFRLYTGFSPKGETSIYLTLKREGEYIQNIQLIVGEIDKKKIKVTFGNISDPFNGKDYGQLFLELRDKKEIIPLNLPILEYFINLKNGIINTNIDPQLNNGIDKIKYKIMNLYK